MVSDQIKKGADRAPHRSLLYALGRAARRMKGKLTVQTRLTSSFASVMRGVGEYSPLLVSR